jgi:hypothetical protein
VGLNINSPAYYTSTYGVIDEVYQMCYKISQNIDLSKYTSCIDSIGITPIIAPDNIIRIGKWKEIKKVLLKSRLAIISLHIDYDTYCNANINEKRNLVLQNVFDSLLVVSKAVKNDFNYEKLVEDILNIVDR